MDKNQKEYLKIFQKKAFIGIGTFFLFLIIAAFLYYGIHVLLLIFAGILIGVVMRGIARYITRYLKIPINLSITLTFILIFGIITMLVMILGPQFYEDTQRLYAEFPNLLERAKAYLSQYSWGKSIVQNIEKALNEGFNNGAITSRLQGIFSSTIASAINVFVIIVIAIYTAFDPNIYIDNFVMIFPEKRRGRVKDIMYKMAKALRWWFLGRLASMFIIGSFIALGLYILGIPLAIQLGLIAFMLEFIPNIGPVLSALPAIFFALVDNPVKVFYVVLLFVGVQFAESYFLSPMIDSKTVSIPPALLISFQILVALWLGAFALIIATPILVIIIVLIQTLYVEDTLEEDIKVLGEK